MQKSYSVVINQPKKDDNNQHEVGIILEVYSTRKKILEEGNSQMLHSHSPTVGSRCGLGSIYWKIPFPRGGISANVILGQKYEKGKRKRWKMFFKQGRKRKEKGRKQKEKEKMGSKRVK
jgi:hypothetical protein